MGVWFSTRQSNKAQKRKSKKAKWYVNLKLNQQNNFCKQYFPINDTALHKIYIVGKDSIVNNLLWPNVQFIDGNSYMSICQCIVNFLASEIKSTALSQFLRLMSCMNEIIFFLSIVNKVRADYFIAPVKRISAVKFESIFCHIVCPLAELNFWSLMC